MAKVFLFKFVFLLACWSVGGEECDDPSMLQAKQNRSHPEASLLQPDSTPQVLLQGADAEKREERKSGGNKDAATTGVVEEVDCGDRGFYDFDFRPGAGRKLDIGDELVVGSGITLEDVDKANGCGGAAIWNEDVNFDDNDLAECPNDCQMLVLWEEDTEAAADQIDDCAAGPSTITLKLNPSREVLGYEFWDNEPTGSVFSWKNVGDVDYSNVPIPTTDDKKGTGFEKIADLAALPDDVQFLKIKYAGSGALRTLRFCETTTTTTPVGDVIGDPHIHTFEGEHFLLLNQGTFNLWRLSGLQTQFPSSYNDILKKVNVDWQVYTHYSGHKSFTKGLLVVDQSGGTMRQMAEITSKDCQWRIKMPGQEWAPVKESELYFVPDGNSFVTGFKVGLETQHLKMKMNTEHGKTNVAGMFVSCRPSHHINLKMHMMRPGEGDEKYVQGEMRGFKRRKPVNSMLQVNGQMAMKDEEYSVKQSWQKLGGSRVAAEYFEAMDEPGQLSAKFVGTCGEAEKKDATKICAKHLGAKMEHATGADGDFFSDCVFDVCTGSGEVAAELAAELKMFSGMKDKDD